MAETKLSADLRISKRFKYTPIFKTSFIKAKEKPPKKCCSCCQTKAARIIGYTSLGLLLSLCIAGAVMVWTTNTLHTIFTMENLPLRNNSQSFEWWRNSPVKPKVHFYFFNYTNVYNFLSRGEKLKVEEIGPYTYLEHVEKVNLVWNNNGTITFQDRRWYTFVPELSIGPESDLVIVPNIPLFAAAASVRNEMYFVKLSLATFLHSINAKPFVNVNVSQLLMGYEDPIYTVGRTIMSIKHKMGTNKFGILAEKVGVSPSRITIGTGELSMENLGVISHFNGEDSVDFWQSEECNRIDGVEGALFSPQAVKERSRLHIYHRDICRRFPLVFKEYSQGFYGIPTMRFHPPRDVFAHPSENPENLCFCDPSKNVCPPSGVFNVSPCVYDGPFFMSFPHFYLGDPVLLDTIEGLHPEPEKHDSYLDLHPEFGVPLSGRTSIQFNLMVHKVTGVDHLYRFTDKMILPITYASVVMDELPSDIRTAYFHGFHSARTLQLVLMYGLPVAAAVIALTLLRALRGLRQSPQQEPSFPVVIPPSANAIVAVAAMTEQPDDIFVMA